MTNRNDLLKQINLLPDEIAGQVKELCNYVGTLEYRLATERRRNRELEHRIEDLIAII
jgi:hypothetical protein